MVIKLFVGNIWFINLILYDRNYCSFITPAKFIIVLLKPRRLLSAHINFVEVFTREVGPCSFLS